MPRISDHLSAVRSQQFVGRDEERALFTEAIQSPSLPFYVLHISGPGGVGKTALLHAFAALCNPEAVNTFYLDARNLEPTPQSFIDGLRTALALSQNEDPLQFLAETESLRRRVLFLDTYETLETLDDWIRDAFLTQISDNTLVVLAGRHPLSATWRSDAAWQRLLHSVSLRNLSLAQSHTYLSNRFVPIEQHPALLRFTHGYPLALSLVADLHTQSGNLSDTSKASLPYESGSSSTLSTQASLSAESASTEMTHDIVEALLERFITSVPSPLHRTALEICALVRVTDETLLAEMLPELSELKSMENRGVAPVMGITGSPEEDNGPTESKVDSRADGHSLFQWLRGLTFIDKGKHGVFPHDIVRDVLIADLRWRNKDRYAELHRAARKFYSKHLPLAQGLEQQHLLYDCIFLHRDNAIIREAFTWQESGSVFPDKLRDVDHPALIAMVARHEGAEAARIAQQWFRRQPEATIVFRDRSKETKESRISGVSVPTDPAEPIGFLMMLSLENVEAAESRADPAIDAVYRYLAASAAPLRPGEGVRYLRFWMASGTYQAISPLQSLVVVQAFRHFLASGVRVAFTFFACRDTEFWKPVLEYVDIERIESADFSMNDDTSNCSSDTNSINRNSNRYGVFGHDWRIMPTSQWLERLTMKATAGGEEAPREDPPRHSSPLIVLSEGDFAVAVRDALRNYTNSTAIMTNPLLQSRVVVSLSGSDANRETRVAVLRDLIQELSEGLRSSPRTARSYGPLYHTYLQPAPTQEQAAEHLDLPFSTFRRHLSAGIQTLQQRLWIKETGI